MFNKAQQFGLSGVAIAVMLGMSSTVAQAQDGDEEAAAMEEVVVTATRLKGSATAVLEERKQQAFVADILGAEQISRSGDGDAASALRRVTGLTLVDGKFIYVRGLGERYSSTQLNGAMVPSPDPTRNVIPLDMFPADIIESLSVQKSYSPSMPAHFGGGNVNIRLKSLPDQYTMKLSGSLSSNTNNSDDGVFYNGGGNDWLGKDDGTRAAPEALNNAWENRRYLNDDAVSGDLNRQIARSLKRDFDAKNESVDPNGSLDFSIGNSWDSGDWRYGAMLNVGYSNGWYVGEGYEGQQFSRQTDSISLDRGFDDVNITKYQSKWSSMLSAGIDYKRNHRIDMMTMVLHDTEDQMKEKFGITNNIKRTDGLQVRDVDVLYQERQLIVNQIKGMHTFPEWSFLGIDWKYSDAKSNRYAPGNVETRYIMSDANEDGIFDINSEIGLTKASTASRYSYQDLDDSVENVGWNASLPISLDKWEIELKTGADYVEKVRRASARRFDIDSRPFTNEQLRGNSLAGILTDDALTNVDAGVDILRDTTADGDDYDAVQKIDAYYFEADMFFDERWRISGGVRWEDFRQVVVGLTTEGQFDLDRPRTEDDWLELVVKEDDFYPALAVTYIYSPEMQFRFSYSQTTVRPDLREVSKSTYLDPLTLDPIRGTPGLRPTQLKNYDVRWEWYMENGDNLSVALFYKDMGNPIESVQSPAQDGPPLIVMANAESGELAGIEVEFLKDLKILSDWELGDFWGNTYLSGNVTLSDSEIVINQADVLEQTGLSTAITNSTRRLTGHSAWVANLQLGYDSTDGNHTASLIYNVFGPRIIVPGIDGWDDNFEQPFHSLDLVYTYFPSYSSQIKFSVKNILDQKKEIEFENTLRRSELRGIGFGVSYSVDF